MVAGEAAKGGTSSREVSVNRRTLFDAIAALVGRLLIVYLFVGAASYHLSPAHWGTTIADMQSHGVPIAKALLLAAMFISSAASIALLFSWQTKHAAFILAGYTVIVSAVLHNPLHPAVSADVFLFYKDLAIAGALLALGAASARKDS